MREIKFRVWTGMTMEYSVTVGKFGAFYVNPGAKGDGLDDKDSACMSPFNTIYPATTPVMQFTGLKGKNGKDEIYERDIVRVTVEQLIGGDVEIIGVVQWNGDGYWEVDFPQHGQTIGFQAFTENGFERLGNEYENPELLDV